MKSFFKHNSLILSLYGIGLIYALFMMMSFEKVIVHIYFNRLVGNELVNHFFYYITYFGDGLVAPFLLLVILIYNARLGIYSTATFLSASLFSQLLKRCFFDDVNRPLFVFQWEYHYPSINYVPDVDRYIHNSFPSGHATQAFAIFMCLAFMTKKQYLKILFLVIALLTSFSRVYLSQHWLNDITAGSIIGVIFSILFYYLLIGRNKLQQLDKPLYKLKPIGPEPEK